MYSTFCFRMVYIHVIKMMKNIVNSVLERMIHSLVIYLIKREVLYFSYSIK